MFRPKKSDSALLAKFYFTDEELNLVAAELDSFDGRKDPERCTALVTKLRSCQDKVLNVIEKIILDAIPVQKANRDFRVKFPDDVLQESLAGQLWFGAECLAAGSSIMNRELESASMRPLARALTKNLDRLRSLLREQCLRSYSYNERIREALVIFDKLFAEFEYSYVSTMVPVKSKKEYDLLQEITVLFSETVQRALKIKLLNQDQIDDCDPALMFTIPRLAIVCGLLIYPNGPLNPLCDRSEMSEMFRPFQTLLLKIKELLQTLTTAELGDLEKSLCTNETVEKVKPSTSLVDQNSQTDPGFEDSIDNTEISVNLQKTLENKSSEDLPNETLNGNNQQGESQSNLTPTGNRNFESHLNKSESRDSGLQSENASTSGTVSCEVVSPDDDKFIVEDDDKAVAISTEVVQKTQDVEDKYICDNDADISTPDIVHKTRIIVNNIDNNISDNVEVETENVHEFCLSIVDNLITTCVGQPSDNCDLENPQISSNCDACSDCDKLSPDLDSNMKSDNDIVDEKQTITDNTLPSNETASNAEVDSQTTSKSERQGCSVDTGRSSKKQQEQHCTTIQVRSSKSQEQQEQCCSSKKVDSSKQEKPSCSSDKIASSKAPKQEERGCSSSRSHSKLTRQNKTRKMSIDRIHCKTGSNTSSTTPETRRVRRVRYNGTISNTFSSVHTSNYDWDRESVSSTGSSDTSSYTSDSQDDEEIQLAVKAAAVASKKEIRSRFHSSSDLIHRLFVCISGVADQLQTNYAGDLRNILKSVFDMNTSCESDEIESVGTKFDRTQHIQAQLQAARVNRYRRSHSNHSHRARDPPEWVPDEQVLSCTSCHAVFTFVRRRHHCRNCGKIFCGQCSNNFVPLPHFGHSAPVRVCNRCFMFQVTPFIVES